MLLRREKRRLIAIITIAAVLLVAILIWVFFGNAITLAVRSNKDLETLNSGSLNVPGTPYYTDSEIPEFVRDIFEEEVEKDDAFYAAISPYLHFERSKIHGFLTGNTVEYTISAPDMENWLLNQADSYDEEMTEEDFIDTIISYIPDAPIRDRTVTVEYVRKGVFNWEGVYTTPEFADAISGGMNSAYNKLYEEMLKELEGIVK